MGVNGILGEWCGDKTATSDTQGVRRYNFCSLLPVSDPNFRSLLPVSDPIFRSLLPVSDPIFHSLLPVSDPIFRSLLPVSDPHAVCVSVCPVFQPLNRWANFDETWYECFYHTSPSVRHAFLISCNLANL
jgi:hypothetical protein